ncbi:tribbles homolog 2-like [Lethenteron reissneri]|uniref:tribbles homolog 2-like n=1 Tax=Lethenteron reissneri TaxID=7753 RepID=UPI002AB7C745|nr:tribbles homolog 2-like [Lethenteron reissneri]XP_061425205.1 tribbles homolog 2-like [Lethenteron reissneri]
MNVQRSLPIAIARPGPHARHKTHGGDPADDSGPPPGAGGWARRSSSEQQGSSSSSQAALSPGPFPGSLGSPTPPGTPGTFVCASRIGHYVLLEPLEGQRMLRAVNTHTGRELVCKVFDVASYRDSLAAYFRIPPHESVACVDEVLLGEHWAYAFLERGCGDLHSHVRACKRLPEEEAARLFHQAVSAVDHCHQHGIVLRDLKLRKFVFRDEDRMSLRLEGLEDVCVLHSDDDSLAEKVGCPAYVSPEILTAGGSSGRYSGRAADVWSLGVMLYTMLVGQYPFHESEPTALFARIRRGQYALPEALSPKARCLIRDLLRRDPSERLTARDILHHPWFACDFSAAAAVAAREPGCGQDVHSDQLVPEGLAHDGEDPFFG